MLTFTLTWTLIGNDEPFPVFGVLSDVSIGECYKRIKGIWDSRGYSLSNPPRVWAYQICDQHGRTFETDQLIEGKWMERELETI